jgi:hypothetical protein
MMPLPLCLHYQRECADLGARRLAHKENVVWVAAVLPDVLNDPLRAGITAIGTCPMNTNPAPGLVHSIPGWLC